MPKNVVPLPIETSFEAEGQIVYTFGFPASKPEDGLLGECKVLGTILEGIVPVLQLSSNQVSKGFSGAPLWDNTNQKVIGMVTSIIGTRDVKIADKTVRLPFDSNWRQTETAFAIPAKALRQACSLLSNSTNVAPSPYRGLFAFQEQDEQFFYGREIITSQLIESVQKKSLLAVIGPSGSGKSSVIFAGLVPHLRREGKWFIAAFRPGKHPLRALAAALVPLLEPNMSEIDRLLEINKLTERIFQGDLTIQDIIEYILQKNPYANRFLLVVDQFEEIYTFCQEKEFRQKFLEQLLFVANAGQKDHLLTSNVAITLRADFLGQALSDRFFSEIFNENSTEFPSRFTLKLIGPMSRSELERAIEKPAEKLSVRIEEGLTERILDTLDEEISSLPLLEFALTLLWDRQENGVLTHTSYGEIGGVQKALASYADKVYERLNETQQQKAQHVFVQLIHPGEGTKHTRRVATRAEVGKENWDLVTLLADARLVVTSYNEISGEEIVELVHEALIDEWGYLREWIELDYEFRIWQERLRTRISEWKRTSCGESELLHDFALAEAEVWQIKRSTNLSQIEKEFIRLSKEARSKEKERWKALYEEAEQQRKIALARQLAAQAELIRNRQVHLLERSVLLAVESMRISPSIEAYQTLHQALKLLPRRPIASLEHSDNVYYSQFALNGQYLITISTNGVGSIWKVSSGRKITELKYKIAGGVYCSNERYLVTAAKRGGRVYIWEILSGSQIACLQHKCAVIAIAISRDGHYIATASLDKTLRIWRFHNGIPILIKSLARENLVSRMEFSPEGNYLANTYYLDRDKDFFNFIADVWEVPTGRHMADLTHEDGIGGIVSLVFSPNGKYIATAGENEYATIWEVPSGQVVVPILHKEDVALVNFSPDSRYLATTTGWGRTARVWEIESASLVAQLVHTEIINDIAFSPDGCYLATASNDNTAGLWEVNGGSLLARYTHEGSVDAVTFSYDGRYLATSGYDKTVKIWEVGNTHKRTKLMHASNVQALVFSPDGHYLATAGRDGMAKIWDINIEVEKSCLHHDDDLWDIAFSPKGNYLATACWDKTARLWEAADGREIARFSHKHQVISVAFSPDEKYLVPPLLINPPPVVYYWVV